MLDVVVLNLLFILFPIICYLLYIVYANSMGKEGNNLFFSLSMLSSIYLIIKYSTYFKYDINILTIILLICMLKKEVILSIVVCVCMIMSIRSVTNINVIYIIIYYVIQNILFFVVLKNKKNETKLISFTAIGILCSLLLTSYSKVYIIISYICYSLISYFLMVLINKSKKIIKIYGTVKDIEDEKTFRETLFKVTHEIKNPIAVCKGYLDMMDTNNIKQVNKYIPIIKQEIERTLTLMSDFLNLTKLSINKSKMDIVLLLDDICSSVDELLIEKNIHFIFDIIEDAIYIEGDYDRLKQVILNIIKNSMESINNKIGLIKLSTIIRGNYIVINITDNGCGMNKSTLKQIGNPFFTTKKNGTGLGVKLSNEIIELHDGKIKYISKEGVGTTVKIYLKIKK